MTIHILAIGDRPEKMAAIRSLLANTDSETHTVSSAAQALQIIPGLDFAVILIDIQMSRGRCFRTAEQIRTSGLADTTPIIFLPSFKNISIRDRSAGEHIKTLDPEVLLSEISIFIELYRQRRELENTIANLAHQKKLLERMAIHDDLTDLYNRRHLKTVLHQEFQRSHRYGTELGCLLLDLDHFKNVNDSHGHGFGDFVLSQFSHRLMSVLRASDFVFRFGGEEFLILLPQTGRAGTCQVAEKIRLANATEKFTDGERSVLVTVSIGVACFDPLRQNQANDLISQADQALYQAKKTGRNLVVLFETRDGAPNEAVCAV